MKLKMIMITWIAAIGLTACGAPSVEDLKEDQALLEQTMVKCMGMDPGEVKKDEACINAGIAMKDIQKNMMGNMMNMMGK